MIITDHSVASEPARLARRRCDACLVSLAPLMSLHTSRTAIHHSPFTALWPHPLSSILPPSAFRLTSRNLINKNPIPLIRPAPGSGLYFRHDYKESCNASARRQKTAGRHHRPSARIASPCGPPRYPAQSRLGTHSSRRSAAADHASTIHYSLFTIHAWLQPWRTSSITLANCQPARAARSPTPPHLGWIPNLQSSTKPGAPFESKPVKPSQTQSK